METAAESCLLWFIACVHKEDPTDNFVTYVLCFQREAIQNGSDAVKFAHYLKAMDFIDKYIKIPIPFYPSDAANDLELMKRVRGTLNAQLPIHKPTPEGVQDRRDLIRELCQEIKFYATSQGFFSSCGTNFSNVIH